MGWFRNLFGIRPSIRKGRLRVDPNMYPHVLGRVKPNRESLRLASVWLIRREIPHLICPLVRGQIGIEEISPYATPAFSNTQAFIEYRPVRVRQAIDAIRRQEEFSTAYWSGFDLKLVDSETKLT